MLFTSDLANIHHVFSKNFSNYPRVLNSGRFSISWEMAFSVLIFELWGIHRKTTLSLLTHAEFSGYLERTVWDKVETGLMPLLDRFCEHGTDFDLQDVFQRLAFDNICKLVLNYDPCSLSVHLPYLPCEKAFSSIAEPLFYRHVIPEGIRKLLKWLKIGGEKTLIGASRAFDDFIYPRVGLLEEEDGGLNLLQAFKKVYLEKKIGPSEGLRDFLKDTALSLMFAGRDTTSTCLTWLFWLIAKNPSTDIKILEEIEREVVELKERKRFNVEESWKLIYLHGALCESLRLFPLLALEHKAAIRPDILPSGHHLHENSKLIISFYLVGRMESVWGKDCLEFKPDRWISDKGRIKHEPSYKFPALGKEMAFNQMKMVAATIIYHYSVNLVEGHIVSPRDSIIIQARHGLKVRLSKRNIYV